jgi:peptidoglycan/xylan/chitin deacetylase (PgdA/CDA1 family)
MNQRRSSILTYHSLDRSGSAVSVSPQLFRAQMEWLAASGAPVVPLSQVRDTPGAVALTFDDGFRNFHEHALPVLVERRFPATVFVVSGYCGGENRWPQPMGGIPRLDLMSWGELAEAAASGVALGAHTVTHPHLSRLDEVDVERELAGCRMAIEDRTGRPVDTFAYPYGDVSPRVRRAAGRHFRLACGTRLAFLPADSDVLELPRIDIYYLRSRRWFEALGQTDGATYIMVRRWIREARGLGGQTANPGQGQAVK